MTDVTCTYNYFLLSKINFNRIIHSLFKKSRFVATSSEEETVHTIILLMEMKREENYIIIIYSIILFLISRIFIIWGIVVAGSLKTKSLLLIITQICKFARISKQIINFTGIVI